VGINTAPVSPARWSQLPIKRLEVTDLKIEFVFPISQRQDGSGEKGFATLDLEFVFHVERERPRSFPQK
jgi:hypothetical protein